MRILKIIISLFFLLPNVFAQELKCNVQVLYDQIGGTDGHIFQTLKTSVFEFMNNTKWTNEKFQDQEKIECSILINIEKRDAVNQFEGSIQVQSRRPIYKSSYNSPLLNQKDKDIQFTYTESDPFTYAENTFTTNLTSVLAYYAYMIIAYDYDSYSLNGGTPYFQKAQTVVTNAQGAVETGWQASQSTKNRYWLVDNALSPNFAPMREAMYKYHRLGLDVMYTNKEGGRAAIYEGLQLLEKVHKDRPSSFNMQILFNAKADELVNIFSQGSVEEKNNAVNILSEIDASNSNNKYQKILSSGN